MGGRTVSLAELAIIIGRSERTLIADTNAGMPVLERGVDGAPSSYDTAACVTWLIVRASARMSATTEEERRRLLAAQATRAELELKVRNGSLVDAKAFGAGALRAASELRESLLAIPARIAQVLDPASPQRARGVLERELQQSLRGLAHYLDTLPARAAEQPEASGAPAGAQVQTSGHA